MIILLGEIVVSVGAAALDVEDRGASYWVGLLSGLVLAAALWWIYFDSAAEVNEYVLRSSGGNPALAYGLYAGGHLGPAFSLLAIAAGVNLVLHEHPTSAAVWLVTAGLGGYLIGTRAVSTTTGNRTGRWLGLALVIATVCLALLQHVIAATGVVAVTAVWAVGIAVVVSRRDRTGCARSRPTRSASLAGASRLRSRASTAFTPTAFTPTAFTPTAFAATAAGTNVAMAPAPLGAAGPSESMRAIGSVPLTVFRRFVSGPIR